jgi:hypothetical protein
MTWWLLAACSSPAPPSMPAPVGQVPPQPEPHVEPELPTLTLSVPTGAPAVCINELVARNASTFADAEGRRDDWVELHNPGPEAIELAGWVLTDGVGAVELSGVVPPGGFVVWMAEPEGPLRLDADGESLTLVDPDGREDTVVFGPMEVDEAAWRTSDCCPGDCWARALGGTPGASNTPGRWERVLASGDPLLMHVEPADGWHRRAPDASWTPHAGGHPVDTEAGFAVQQEIERPERGRLALRVAFADGVLVWLDGEEVFRDNLEPGAEPLTPPRLGAWRGSLHSVSPEGPPLRLSAWVVAHDPATEPWIDLEVELWNDE